MDNIKLYEVDAAYIDYLSAHAEHLFRNKQPGQHHERKYIGVVLCVNGMNYFAPLSSFKEKHLAMKPGLDFLKVRDYAVINLNNMFPVPDGCCTYVDIREVSDYRYKTLLQAEYRIIKSMQDRIRKNAALVYNHKLKNGNSTALAKRCNDFELLEFLCRAYSESQGGQNNDRKQ